MGYWFPTFTVTGGLNSGQTPSGDLSSLFDKLTTISSTASGLVGYATIQDTPQNPRPEGKWVGAYGTSDEALYSYAIHHVGEGAHDVPWMIFTIQNPEGAQFYKQELVVEARINCTISSGGTPGVDAWGRYNIDMVYFRVYRREYYSPTSIPEITHTFYSGALGYTAYYYFMYDNPRSWHTVNYKFPASYATYNGYNYLCFGSYQQEEYPNWLYDPETQSYTGANQYLYSVLGIPTAVLQSAFGEFKLDENDDPNIDPDPPFDPGDNPNPTPGPKEPEYDPVPIPPMPTVTALGAGFLSLYSPSSTLLNMFAAEMYSDNILDIIHNYFSNVADMIAGLAIVPFFVPITGFSKHRVGAFRTSMAFPIVANQFIDVDCGSVDTKHYYNSFLDYAPNTKIMVWLPYIGYQELNADEVMGQTLSIKYRCDILSGACVAFVMIGSGSDPTYSVGRVIAQFTGNVLVQVPAAATSYDSMVSSAINILTGAVGIAAGGAIGAAGAGAAAGAAKAPSATAGAVGAQVGLGVAGTASNIIMGMKPTVARNGTPGSTAGYMGVQKPYLIKIVPRSAIAPNHIQLQGYPSNYGGVLGSLSGYCEVQEIQLNIDPNGTPPNVDEKTEIYRLLKGGVVI